LRISTESRAALSAMFLGITSNDLAKQLIMYYSFPAKVLAKTLNLFEISNSVAPPPATMVLNLRHLLTIIIASLRDLSAS